MTEIVYMDIHEFTIDELQDLFLSVEWSSDHFPEKLQTAMKNFETVISASDGEKPVDMICAMDDGIMTAYIHYLQVRPEYHDRSIAKELVAGVKKIYKNYMRITVVGCDDEVGFYESCGFEKAEDASPLFITDLWT